jgi:hypothetical protein
MGGRGVRAARCISSDHRIDSSAGWLIPRWQARNEHRDHPCTQQRPPGGPYEASTARPCLETDSEGPLLRSVLARDDLRPSPSGISNASEGHGFGLIFSFASASASLRSAVRSSCVFAMTLPVMASTLTSSIPDLPGTSMSYE